MRHISVSVLIVFWALAALFPSAWAEDKITEIRIDPMRKLIMEYDVYWSAFRIVTATGEADFTDDSYHVSVAARTRGFLKLFVNGKSLAEASGSIAEDGSILPRLYQIDGVWNKKRYARTLTFFPDGSLDQFEFIRPDNDDKDAMEWEPVPVELQRGPDPLSMLFNAARDPWGMAIDQTNGRPANLTSFDGIRTIEYKIDCAEDVEQLKKTSRSIYYGAAIRCEIMDRQIAGFYIEKDEKKKRKLEKKQKKQDKKRKPVILWLGAIEGTPWYVPVRLEMRGQGRNLKVYLKQIRNEDRITEVRAASDQ